VLFGLFTRHGAFSSARRRFRRTGLRSALRRDLRAYRRIFVLLFATLGFLIFKAGRNLSQRQGYTILFRDRLHRLSVDSARHDSRVFTIIVLTRDRSKLCSTNKIIRNSATRRELAIIFMRFAELEENGF
jgi:hypothetical protein